ncbi:MAG: hypothetical protein BWY82_01575 [Verrucomicrobia bacterium ADurb.Bin474]|nr:MAG: hypothetical protein BWY82_01575 [Verrucomicrobia bacterium ADurb.Bin474]
MSQGTGNCTGTGSQIKYVQSTPVPEALTNNVDELLRLGSGNKCPPIHLNPDAAEHHISQNVLKRLTLAATHHHGSHPGDHVLSQRTLILEKQTHTGISHHLS